jgi:hypothetical protein
MATFTKEDQAKMNEVMAFIQAGDDVTDQHFKDLKALHDRKAASTKALKESVGKVVAELSQLNLSFPEFMKAQGDNPIFPSSAIMAYAAESGWRFPNMGKAPKSNDGGSSTRKTRTPKAGTALFTVQPPGSKGAAKTIMKEDGIPEDDAPIGAKLVWLVEQSGDIKANLMAHQADNTEAKIFLASKEGKDFINGWVEWLKKHAPKQSGHKAEAKAA